MSNLQSSRSYAVIVAGGVLLAVSPFMPWIKAYSETNASLLKIAGDSTDMGFLPWLLAAFGILVALGAATRRTVMSYVVILICSVVMLVAGFFWTSEAITEAYVVGGPIEYGMWVGFGGLGLVVIASAVELLRI